MPKEEAVISFIVATEKDRGLPRDERPIIDGMLTIGGGREHSEAGAKGGRKKGNTVRATGEVGSLTDEGVGVEEVGVEEGKSEVIKLAHVDSGHVGVDVAWALSLLGFLRLRPRVRTIQDRKEAIPA
jgi:hypothetical protein